MVALSTTDIMEPQNLPIEITPLTDGKWKWVSTNTLQFIPATTLKLSSNYQVKVNSGLKSIEGLSITPTQSFFKTRNLRYLNPQPDDNANQQIVYNQPYRIYFNQPVDLKKPFPKLAYSTPIIISR